jgi:hypothetical protein
MLTLPAVPTVMPCSVLQANLLQAKKNWRVTKPKEVISSEISFEVRNKLFVCLFSVEKKVFFCHLTT